MAPVAGVGRRSAGSSVHAGRWRTGDVQLFTFGARKPSSAVATVRARDVHAHATITAQRWILRALVHVVLAEVPVVSRKARAGKLSIRKRCAGSTVGAWRGDAAVH